MFTCLVSFARGIMELMKKSGTPQGLHEDDHPATKRDLESLSRATTRDLKLLRSDLGTLEAKLVSRFDELRDHFDAAVENVVEELRGANADEISLLKDADANHEQRLTAVERKIGLR